MEVNPSNNYPKTDLRYWEKRVTFQLPASRTYSVHIQHGNRRMWVNLRTANKEQAAALARKFYEDLRSLGWEEVLRRRKAPKEEKKVNVTIGEYLNAVREKCLIHLKTLEAYAAALRKIASDIHGIAHNGASRSEWRSRVDSIKLATLTAEAVEAWRADFIRRGNVNPVKERSARVSANSFIGCARSLFGADVIARVHDVVELPSPTPFAGVKVQKVRVARYRSGFDMAALLESARQELAPTKPEQFKIFLLAAMAGLRRNEIDKLPWTAFCWNERLIRIQATEFFRPKSHESEGDVLVDSELLELFRGFYARRKSEFVIESNQQPKHAATFGRYRCQDDIRALIGWLRAHGVLSRTPLHTLRKEYGSQINARYGLTAAQEMLRHSDVSTTASHYIEGKKRSVLGFSHLLKNDRTIIPIDSQHEKSTDDTPRAAAAR
jgi:Phage integrase family